jgi:uncharacterized protein (TIGR03067 family)
MFRAILFVGLCYCSSGLRADDAADKALKALQGEWKVEKVVDKGQELPNEVVGKMRFTIKGSDIIPSDNPKDVATIKLDVAQKPAWLDLTDRSKETMLGVYELKDDTLTICLAAPKSARPKEFKSTKDDKTVLLVLKRVAK